MNHGEWTLRQDWIVVSQIENYRKEIEHTTKAISDAKEEYAKRVQRTFAELADRSTGAIIQHFDFIDRLLNNDVDKVPDKYKDFVGIYA